MIDPPEVTGGAGALSFFAGKPVGPTVCRITEIFDEAEDCELSVLIGGGGALFFFVGRVWLRFGF